MKKLFIVMSVVSLFSVNAFGVLRHVTDSTGIVKFEGESACAAYCQGQAGSSFTGPNAQPGETWNSGHRFLPPSTCLCNTSSGSYVQGGGPDGSSPQRRSTPRR